MATLLSRTEAFGYVASSARSRAKPGFFTRFMIALKASREAEARRHIARHQHLVERIEALSRREDAADRTDLPF